MSPSSKTKGRHIIKLKDPRRSGKAPKSLKAPKALKGPKAKKTAKTPKMPKMPKAPVKPKKRRFSDTSSSLSLSNDSGGYSALEDVSDSQDDDEDHVYAAEEEHIITHEREDVAPSFPRPRFHSDDDADDADDDANEDDEDEEGEDVGVDQQNSGDVDDSSSWAGLVSDTDESVVSIQTPSQPILSQDPPTTERRVRFAGVPDSDSDSTDSDTDVDADGLFPDIFVAQDNLDSNFRREIEEDPDDSSNSGTYWDFSNGHGSSYWGAESDIEEVAYDPSEIPTPATPATTSQYINEMDLYLPVGAEGVEELDGYETDGDTTEEDIPEVLPRKKHPIRRPVETKGSDSENDRPTRPQRGKPRVGHFDLDDSSIKPICVLNPMTRKMMIFTPSKQGRLDLSPEQFNLDFILRPESPIMSNPGSLMMSAMIAPDPFGDMFSQAPTGPESAFFALASDAIAAEESSDSEMQEEEDDEQQLKIEDFITFDDHSSDDEDQGDVSEYGNTDGVSTPSRRPSTAVSVNGDASALHPLLNHFNINSDVGSFRRNQVNQQLILSDKATQDSLAFSNPYFHGTLRGIKQGNLSNAATPLTPERRQKKSAFGFSKSPLDAIPQKRKVPPSSLGEGTDAYKRHRSISDVHKMHISP